ncbi:hypothetical protein MA16_Dca007328 [Dendrobium catenatum]|uniref:Uncharacterized protein n=1 Tax=Dendrobium catenatum TaxID=906689 RepID=A0A2I0W8H7_9ASPA|nr:hypothetical protein MA16_Dca007328 [Dendrobium catenatum]
MESQLTVLVLLLSSLVLISQSAKAAPNPSPTPIKAVNLGGWLVTEGWITPNLFDEIPVNKDLLDGTQIQLKSVTKNNYLSANNSGGSAILASQSSASGSETFKDNLVATSTSSCDSDSSHTFEIVRNDDDPNRIRIRAPNGSFLEVKPEGLVTADYSEDTNWGDDDPSIFLLTNVRQIQAGEFQVTNGYGADKAPSVMMFMSENGLNAVRIPVGWWIRFDQNPPHPFVGGSLQALDNAFSWAEEYNIKVIIDLHAAPGSQNGWEHSGTRDGTQLWGKTDDTIKETVAVIDFLTSRYANRTGLYAIELMNEPLAPGVTIDRLKKYYKVGYDTVRKYSDVYVIMSNRLLTRNPTELIRFASGFSGSVIDVHYYNMFSKVFEDMTVQQNINYIKKYRASTIKSLTISNGPLIFIGEWVDDIDVIVASKDDYQRFGAAQLEVYGMATFGWSYWTLKNVRNHWSLEWMIKNGYITL